MKILRPLIYLPAVSTALFLASCANQKPIGSATSGAPVNPHPPGTYEHFKAEPSYPKTHGVWKNDELLGQTHNGNAHIKINLATQRGMLMNNGELVMDYPICSGVKSRPTPTGTFYVLEKIVDKSSNRYGKIYDASGSIINGDADALNDTIPEGGRFEGAPMKYWMRLTNDGVGHHIGPVKRYPASHACIRGPRAIMPVVYSKVKLGTRFDVE